LIVGIGSAFGEVSHFGYLKSFPSEYVGPFWSGTGICGLAGSLMYLVLHSLGVPDYVIFFSLVPVAFIYLSNFLLLHRLSCSNDYFQTIDDDFGENSNRGSIPVSIFHWCCSLKHISHSKWQESLPKPNWMYLVMHPIMYLIMTHNRRQWLLWKLTHWTTSGYSGFTFSNTEWSQVF
jgi:hypothetical protein